MKEEDEERGAGELWGGKARETGAFDLGLGGGNFGLDCKGEEKGREGEEERRGGGREGEEGGRDGEEERRGGGREGEEGRRGGMQEGVEGRREGVGRR